jgi:hypothetical protein
VQITTTLVKIDHATPTQLRSCGYLFKMPLNQSSKVLRIWKILLRAENFFLLSLGANSYPGGFGHNSATILCNTKVINDLPRAVSVTCEISEHSLQVTPTDVLFSISQYVNANGRSKEMATCLTPGHVHDSQPASQSQSSMISKMRSSKVGNIE